MDPFARTFYTARFTTEFHRRGGNAFQDLFADIMEARHGDSFFRVRPWGKMGDRKNDGYLASERILFQVYAPREMTAREAVRKIDEDFRGALPHWREHFDKWVFVHNDPDGAGPQVAAKLLELGREETVEVTAWGYSHLLSELLSMEVVQVAPILGELPVTPGLDGWSPVTFDDQRSLEAALRGDSMGPRDVTACPPAPEVAEVLARLAQHDAVALIGPSGSGKSMVAWHVCHELQRAGWMIFERVGQVGSVPEAGGPALLLMDDVQAMGVPITSARARSELRLLAVSTNRVPGFRTQVRVSGERAVVSIADALRDRIEDLLPVLQRFDSHVGERPFDTPVASKIDFAAQGAAYPWQFMFNLGSGHLRLRAVIEKLGAEAPLADVLFAVSARQLATRDGGCPIDWLRATVARWGHDPADLEDWLTAIDLELRLVRTRGSVSTPHPRVASVVLNLLFLGHEGQVRRELFYDQFRDDTVEPLGFAWLLNNLDYETTLRTEPPPDDLVELVVARCFASEDRTQACWALHAAHSRWPVSSTVLAPYANVLTRWVEEGHGESSVAFSRLVNDAYSRRMRELRLSQGSGSGLEWVDAADPARVAAWASRATPQDAFGLANLLERLVHSCTWDWSEAVAPHLDVDQLCTSLPEASIDDVYQVATMCRAVYYTDTGKGLRLARAVAPSVAAAINADPLTGWMDARDLFQDVCGYIRYFLGDERPSEDQRAAGGEVVARLDPEAVAKALSTARRRDLESWGDAMTVFRDVSPDFTAQVAELLDLDRVLGLFDSLLDSPTELDRGLVAFALAEHNQPVDRIVEFACHRVERLGFRAAYLAPGVLTSFVADGGMVDIGLGGGLPRWKAAHRILGHLHQLDHDTARAVLAQQRDALSGALVLPQSNSVDGAGGFIEVASSVDPSELCEAFRAVDPGAAQAAWAARLAGSKSERAEALAVVRSVPPQVEQLHGIAQGLLRATPDEE